jgi:high affinity Mn2+ porin
MSKVAAAPHIHYLRVFSGLAGYVNLDVVRNPTLSSEPYLARLWLRKVIPLSDETIEVERNPLSLLTTLPVRRIDIHVGKMSLPDFSTSTR